MTMSLESAAQAMREAMRQTDVAPGFAVPNDGWNNIDRNYPFPVTGQSGA